MLHTYLTYVVTNIMHVLATWGRSALEASLFLKDLYIRHVLPFTSFSTVGQELTLIASSVCRVIDRADYRDLTVSFVFLVVCLGGILNVDGPSYNRTQRSMHGRTTYGLMVRE